MVAAEYKSRMRQCPRLTCHLTAFDLASIVTHRAAEVVSGRNVDFDGLLTNFSVVRAITRYTRLG